MWSILESLDFWQKSSLTPSPKHMHVSSYCNWFGLASIPVLSLSATTNHAPLSCHSSSPPCISPHGTWIPSQNRSWVPRTGFSHSFVSKRNLISPSARMSDRGNNWSAASTTCKNWSITVCRWWVSWWWVHLGTRSFLRMGPAFKTGHLIWNSHWVL